MKPIGRKLIGAKVANIPEDKMLPVSSIDPELDRLYREHAIAVGFAVTQITQMPSYPEPDKEPDHDLEPLDECSSTFSGL